MATTYDRVQLVELRVKKAALLIERQRAQIADLQQNLDLVLAHNAELKEYAENYKQDTKLIEESIAASLSTLDTIEGLDDVVDNVTLDELDAADNFAGGEAILDDLSALDIM